jgi:hypothetical protein
MLHLANPVAQTRRFGGPAQIFLEISLHDIAISLRVGSLVLVIGVPSSRIIVSDGLRANFNAREGRFS